MNWKLIFQLSAFGLIMAFATVSLIPQNIEPAFWIVIFIFCAYIIARVCSGKYFLHGLLLGLVNCIWVTAAHVGFYLTYLRNHPAFATWINLHTPISGHPRLSMIITAPIFGLASGLVIGLFAFIASKLVSKKVVVN
jgi:hypothetical protein